jgi:hypothetical protein
VEGGAMNDCWGGCGDNGKAASVSTVGPGSAHCARLHCHLCRHGAAFVVDNNDEARTRPPTRVGILIARMQGGDEDVWQTTFDDD